MCGPAYGPDRSSPGRGRDSLGADAAMGRIGTYPFTILDVCLELLEKLAAIVPLLRVHAVITRILRHGKIASVPPPIAPARSRQETFDWVA